MKVLTIHNLRWPHYKNALFAEIQFQAKESGVVWDFVHIARNELSRKNLENQSTALERDYEYEVLFDDYLENISSIQIFKALLATLNKYKPDVLNITGFSAWYWLLIELVTRLKGIKVVISNDSTAGDNQSVWWKKVIKKMAVKNAHGFFCFGRLAVDYMKSLGAKDAEILAQNCGVVDNVKIAEIYESSEKKNDYRAFIYVGRFLEIKNLSMLLRSFANTKNNDWKLILLGSGDQEAELKKLALTLGIEKQLEWISGKPWYEVPKYLKQADVLVLPSKSEPWGLVVNEAMACGMPVIVSDKCGCWPDLVPENGGGFVFNHEDSAELSNCLQKFIKNPELVSKMGDKARMKIQNYSIASAAKQMIAGVKNI